MLTRLSASERRDHLVSAALAVALRQGLDAVTVRAVADEAGVSFGIVHYCFDNKDALVAALMERTQAEQFAVFTDPAVIGSMSEQPCDHRASLESRTNVGRLEQELFAVLCALWRTVADMPDRWILLTESSLMSLRAEPGSALDGVGREQKRIAEQFVMGFLEAVAANFQIRWIVPMGQVNRAALEWVNGIVQGWLVDRDDDAALAAFALLTRWLCGLAEPL